MPIGVGTPRRIHCLKPASTGQIEIAVSRSADLLPIRRLHTPRDLAASRSAMIGRSAWERAQSSEFRATPNGNALRRASASSSDPACHDENHALAVVAVPNWSIFSVEIKLEFALTSPSICPCAAPPSWALRSRLPKIWPPPAGQSSTPGFYPLLSRSASRVPYGTHEFHELVADHIGGFVLHPVAHIMELEPATRPGRPSRI